MRERIRADMIAAMKGGDKRRTATLRLVNAAIKDRDIEARGKGREQVADEEILAMMQKMVKQRDESATIYADAGRDELAAQEREEILIIEAYMPKGLSEAEILEAVDAAIAETGAQSLRDMGRVVGVLKSKFPGQIDFGKASGVVKAKLGG